ncbi:hypothetical protein AVEN_48416-1 [Araneus ventricosus]|uniref:Uncharacterized protein n=1 Tax=Araneus ventricosus TaxID=182803 RepID=A0A4Y2TJ21_ARAVE|nr:hypothetical protein AVEN_48416-1 [Araneus ventricosus]
MEVYSLSPGVRLSCGVKGRRSSTPETTSWCQDLQSNVHYACGGVHSLSLPPSRCGRRDLFFCKMRRRRKCSCVGTIGRSIYTSAALFSGRAAAQQYQLSA